MENGKLIWIAPEYIKHEKGTTWFLVALAAVIGIIIYGIYTDSITTAIVFFLVAGVYFLTHQTEPRMLEVEVLATGIREGGAFFPYSSMSEFWILYHPEKGVRSLHFELAKGRKHEVTIQLGDSDPVAVRQAFLEAGVKEKEDASEPMVEKLIRILKL